MIDLILIGGGGHCKACIDVIESIGTYSIKGILDLKDQVGKQVSGYEIIGTDDDITPFINGHQFLITVGQLKSSAIRTRIFKFLTESGAQLATIISPTAYVSKRAIINQGTIVMHHATVNTGAVLGVNCIINTGSNIEHDCSVGNHVHISTHAVANGDCKIGDECFVGSNAVLSNGIIIPSGTILGAGTVVYKTLDNPGVYAGNPSRQLT